MTSTSGLARLEGKASESALACTARINLFEGSVRSGKTVASLIAWLRYTRSGPAGNLLMVGKTERTLKRNIIDPLIEWLGPKRCRYIQGAGELWILGRRIYVVGANDERAQDKIRGLTLAGAYVDEVSLLPESFWVMLLTRLSVEGAQLIGTTNPDGPTHWLMRADEPAAGYLLRASLWIDHDGQHHGPTDGVTPLDLHRFSFRLDDNPTLPQAYKEALSKEFTGVWHARLIKGLWVVADGVIWSEFDPTPDGRHVTSTIPDNVQAWHVGIDDGTAGTFAAQLLALCEDRIVVARELRWNAKEQHRQLTDTQKSAKVSDWLDRCAQGTWTVDGQALPALPGCNAPTLIHVDPSATSLIRQMELDRWRGVLTLARNDVADGLQYVASLFALDRLQVHESCKGLRQEIPGYVWDAKAAKLGEDRPLKQNDHHADATRYSIMGCDRHWWPWLAGQTDQAA